MQSRAYVMNACINAIYEGKDRSQRCAIFKARLWIVDSLHAINSPNNSTLKVINLERKLAEAFVCSDVLSNALGHILGYAKLGHVQNHL
jgi:hypothetical protein